MVPLSGKRPCRRASSPKRQAFILQIAAPASILRHLRHGLPTDGAIEQADIAADCPDVLRGGAVRIDIGENAAPRTPALSVSKRSFVKCAFSGTWSLQRGRLPAS